MRKVCTCAPPSAREISTLRDPVALLQRSPKKGDRGDVWNEHIDDISQIEGGIMIIKTIRLTDEDWERIWMYMDEHDLDDVPDIYDDMPEDTDD